ncbi:MAG: hypothetical protein WKG52_14470 [Variovorax sp.]
MPDTQPNPQPSPQPGPQPTPQPTDNPTLPDQNPSTVLPPTAGKEAGALVAGRP